MCQGRGERIGEEQGGCEDDGMRAEVWTRMVGKAECGAGEADGVDFRVGLDARSPIA